jgi:hypothetical protein
LTISPHQLQSEVYLDRITNNILWYPDWLALCLVSWLLHTESPVVSSSLTGWTGPPSRLNFNPLNKIPPSWCPWATTHLKMTNVQLTVYIYKQNPISLSPWAIARSLVAISPCPWLLSLNSLPSSCSKHLLSRFMLCSCLLLQLSV